MSFTVEIRGRVHFTDGRVFINDVELYEFLKEYRGKATNLKLEFDTPDLEAYRIDEGILDLVLSLQVFGLITLASCQFHEDGRAWVSVAGDSKILWLGTQLPSEWEIVEHSKNVWRVRTVSTTGTHEREIEELAQIVRYLSTP